MKARGSVIRSISRVERGGRQIVKLVGAGRRGRASVASRLRVRPFLNMPGRPSPPAPRRSYRQESLRLRSSTPDRQGRPRHNRACPTAEVSRLVQGRTLLTPPKGAIVHPQFFKPDGGEARQHKDSRGDNDARTFTSSEQGALNARRRRRRTRSHASAAGCGGQRVYADSRWLVHAATVATRARGRPHPTTCVSPIWRFLRARHFERFGLL